MDVQRTAVGKCGVVGDIHADDGSKASPTAESRA